VIVIRHERAGGWSWHARDALPNQRGDGQGSRKDVALITDGRFSGGSHGFVAATSRPNRRSVGPLAVVRNGDTITIDAEKHVLTLDIPKADLAARLAKWKTPKPYTRVVSWPSTPSRSAPPAAAPSRTEPHVLAPDARFLRFT